MTGAASGIGRGCAFRLAGDRCRVAVVDIDAAGGQATVDRIRADGGDAFFLEVDIGEPDAFERIVSAVTGRWNALHVLVNNAGLDYNEPLSDMTVEAWDRCLAVDLRSVAFSAQAASETMRRSGGGSIINIASVMAWYTFPNYSAYTASKGGPDRSHQDPGPRTGATRHPGERDRSGVHRHRRLGAGAGHDGRCRRICSLRLSPAPSRPPGRAGRHRGCGHLPGRAGRLLHNRPHPGSGRRPHFATPNTRLVGR